MALFVTGDTHGALKYTSLAKFTADGYIRRLSPSSFPEQSDLSKSDYVIICGDFGGVFSASTKSTRELPDDKNDLDWLEKRPFTTLFVPGNHENYDRLTGCKNERLLRSWLYRKMPEEEKEKLRAGYPRKEWHGGYVREIRPSVLMLENGYVFDIDGCSCFTFGGARSHDINGGILNPADFPTEQKFKREYKHRADIGRMFRVLGVSWWEQEMPSADEMERGRENIRSFMKDHDHIDFIFTHDAPASDKIYLGFDADELNKYLESLRDEMTYHKWFYGHLHDNKRVIDNHYLLYDQIIRIH